MKRSAKYIVVPFRLAKGRFFPGEMRKAETEAGALRLAEAMAARFAGVAAFEVIVDEESGDMTEPRELVVYGQVPEMDAAAA